MKIPMWFTLAVHHLCGTATVFSFLMLCTWSSPVADLAVTLINAWATMDSYRVLRNSK